ncbi:MAG: DnaT-like ssDNA-binding protein [Armatimonadota bacterium]
MPDSLTVGTDTYILASTADAFLLKYPGTTAFTGSTETEQEAFLRLACDRMEAMRWKGEPSDADSQALQWPRINITTTNGITVDPDSIPDEIQRAQCWEALAIAQDTADTGAVTRESLQRQGVTNAKFGDVEERYGERRYFAGFQSRQAYLLASRYLNRGTVSSGASTALNGGEVRSALGNFLG